MRIYGIYDLKNNEQLMRVGTLMEIIKFLNIMPRSFDKAIKTGKLIKNQYQIMYLFEELEEVNNHGKINSKSSGSKNRKNCIYN